MSTYLIPKARNMITGQTVLEKDLTGNRYSTSQRQLCQEMADRLAVRMENRTREPWQGFCEEYQPNSRRR